jgi:altronate hydrolase
MSKTITHQAYARRDGRKGIRNVLLVISLVECAHHVAAQICRRFEARGDVHLLNWSGCAPNRYATEMLRALTVHPNVGGVLLVGLGCEGMNASGLQEHVVASGRWCETIIIQETGGTQSSIAAGAERVEHALAALAGAERIPMNLDELVIGTVCGGSDAFSGLSANPVIGRTFDRLLEAGASCIFEETGELVGCDDIIIPRAADAAVAQALKESLARAYDFYKAMGVPSFSPGNATGGLTTIEEKSMGAYCKSGSSKIDGVIAPATQPPRPGLYLMDVVPLGEPKFGFPNINDTAEIIELIACGAHVILFSTGRGSVVGSIISPVIKICSNPKTYAAMEGDMDINAGRVIADEATLDELGGETLEVLMHVADGGQTKSETLGHREAVLTYKGATVANVVACKQTSFRDSKQGNK